MSVQGPIDLKKMDFEISRNRKEVKNYFESLYQTSFEWFKEERGEKHWVLYPVNVYEICTDSQEVRYLHALDKTLISYDGAIVFPPYNASSFYRLFEKSNATRINLSKWVFSGQIVDLDFMFFDCWNLSEILFNQQDSHGVKTLHATFANCYSLNKLDLTWMYSDDIEDVSVCFTWCSNLRELKIPNLHLAKSAKHADVFLFCNEVRSLEIGDSLLERLYRKREKL